MQSFRATSHRAETFVVGSLPDNLAFTPDGTKILVANEGEADDGIDPEGSVSVIDLDTSTVLPLSFNAFDAEEDALIAEGLLIFGQGDDVDVTVSQDVEPEFIAVAPDGSQAFVTLQENNAIAIVDLSGETPEITDIVPLGTKDLTDPVNSIDGNTDDGVANLTTVPNGIALFQPDAITSFELGGQTFFATANEGDARDFDEVEIGDDAVLDPTAFPNAAEVEAAFPDLEVSQTVGDTDGDGDLDQIAIFGGRSFSILDEAGNTVFESGNLIETTLAEKFPTFFNDARSDDAGPEPEAVTVAEVNGETIIFVGLERSAGVLAFALELDSSGDISADFRGFVALPVPGGLPFTDDLDDLVSPEGLLFVPASDSPTGQDLLVVSDEEAGNTFAFNLLLEESSSQTLIDIENVDGTDFDDVINGSDVDNVINSFGGDDIINGGAGSDTLNAGAGDDIIITDGLDTVDGGEGVDTADFSGFEENTLANLNGFNGVIVDLDVNSAGAAGTAGQDGAVLNTPPGGVAVDGVVPAENQLQELDDIENVIGSDFSDGLFGNNEVNVLSGGDGNDVIHGFAGDDFLNGGDDTDTVLFAVAPTGVVVDLNNQVSDSDFEDIVAGLEDPVFAATGGAGNNVLSGFENVTGSTVGNDTLTGDDNDNVLNGLGGDDVLNGGAGDDTLIGGAGADILTFDTGTDNDSVSDFEDGIDLLDLSGFDGIDIAGIVSTAQQIGDDTLITLSDTDSITLTDFLVDDLSVEDFVGGENAGDDILIGDSDDNVLDGGAGNDIVVGLSGDDVLSGGSDNDNVIGGSGDDDISGDEGVDVLIGGSGDDTISGGEGNDRILGGSGSDELSGDEGNDIIFGGSGSDTLIGGEGNDRLIGGSGNDTAIFEGAESDFQVSGNRVTDLRDGSIDTLISIENIVFEDPDLGLI